MYTGSIPVVASTPVSPERRTIAQTPLTDAEKAARDARRAYWSSPLDTVRKRIHAWMNMLFVDHGIVRLFVPNRHEIGPGVWRSSQPSPGQIRWFSRQGGKTLFTLRGVEYRGSFALEKREAERLGLTLIHARCRSDRIVSVRAIQHIISVLRTAETPMLIHCKSGADRMGMVAVLYRHLIMGEPMEKAATQLSGKYLHLTKSRTGVLDYFFEVYLEAYRSTGIDFETWLATECRPEEINRSYVPSGFSYWVEKHILRRE